MGDESSWIIKHLGFGISLLTSCSFFWSILYNIGFYSFFDLDLISSLSISDYLLTGVYFLPRSITYFFIGALIGHLIYSTLIIGGEDKEPSSIKLSLSMIFIMVMLCIFLIHWFFLGNRNDPIVYTIFWLVIGSSILIYLNERLVLKISYISRQVIFFFVLFSLVSLHTGFLEAKNKFNKPEEVVVILNSEKKLEYKFIKYLTDSVLVFKENNVLLINRSQIESITFKNKTANNISVSCKLFDVCL